MKYRTWLAVALLALSSVRVHAGQDLGIGVILGEPTGLSLKYWLNEDRAIDAALAWSFSGENSVQVHADYLFHRFDLFNPGGQTGTMPLYYGLGARVKDKDRHDDTVFGIRFPVGISYLFSEAPFDLFAELVPIIDLAPDVDVGINAAIGFRFYFR